MPRKKKIIKWSLIIVAASLVWLLLLNLTLYCGGNILNSLLTSEEYVTTDISDYGHYIGNYDNKTTTELITSFFPDKIEPYFKDVQYEYRAKKFDTYAFEAYLEFTIEDDLCFSQYISDVTKDFPSASFQYDRQFQIYTVAEDFDLVDSLYTNNSTVRHISSADIRYIFVGKAENRIIYVALGVYDGGGVNTAFLHRFFTRFNIDPTKYERRVQTAAAGQGAVLSSPHSPEHAIRFRVG